MAIINIGDYQTIIDDDISDFIKSLPLRIDDRCKHVYIKTFLKRGGKYKHEYLHRIIANPANGFVVDHINGNTLDNRVCNLRVCKQGENVCNCVSRKHSSKYKGVYWDKKRGKWYAEIKKNRRKIYIGLFDDEHDAGRAYDEAATVHHGEYANLNFKEEATKCS